MITLYVNDKPAGASACHNTFNVETWDHAKVLMWAYAKRTNEMFCMAWAPNAYEPLTNEGFRTLDIPSNVRMEVEKVVEGMNEKDIETIVVSGLNGVFEELAKYGDRPEFISAVVKAAESWAKDCYQ